MNEVNPAGPSSPGDASGLTAQHHFASNLGESSHHGGRIAMSRHIGLCLAAIVFWSAANVARGQAPQAAEPISCVIYPLGDLADDPGFAKWIAETIPEVIQPGTW